MIDRTVGGVGAEVPADDGVAVGRGTVGAGGADGAAGAGDVFDDQRLAERDAHAFAEIADDGVGRPAGRERHDHRDRPVRIILRGSADDADDREQSGQPQPLHQKPPNYSGLMPAALMIGHHFSISALW